MAVTVNQKITRSKRDRHFVPAASGAHIYEGTLVFVNASGYGVDNTGSGANAFAGVAMKEFDNTNGGNGGASPTSNLQSDGDSAIELVNNERFLFTGSGFTQATVGQRIYATDNYTVTSNPAAANAVQLGVCTEYVSATQVWVETAVRALSLPTPTEATVNQTAYATPSATIAAVTNSAVATTAGTQTSPWGYGTLAQANAIPVAINAVEADLLSVKQNLNTVIDALQAAGILG